MKQALILMAVFGLIGAAHAGLWRIDAEKKYSTASVSEANLAGKVVIVDCWGIKCPPCKELLPRMEKLWKSFKDKKFMLVGSHCQGWQPEAVKAIIAEQRLTFPIYEDFGLAEHEPRSRKLPYIYVVNHRGKVVYAGEDERAAEEAAVEAIGLAETAGSLTPGIVFGKTSKYKSLKGQLVLGKNVTSVLKKLRADVDKAKKKTATKVDKAKALEAQRILDAVEEGKADIRQEIELKKKINPEEAEKMIKQFKVSFPEEAL